MNIELKYKFNHRITLILLSVVTLFFGAVGFVYRAIGFLTIPIIVALLSMLMCIDKKRILTATVTGILLVAEICVSLYDYFTIITLSSFLISVLLSYYFLKGKDKAECALFSTALLALLIFVGAALYIIGKYDASTLPEIIDSYLSIYEDFKAETIASIYSMSVNTENTTEVFTTEYLNAFFDAYLNCTVALVCILAFSIVGIAFKLFSALIRKYTVEQDKIVEWRFLPSSVFAYFYFILAILSVISVDTESMLVISIINLYLIFMYVFAYVGYRFINANFKSKGKNFNFIFLIMIVAFSSIAIQILALIGAYATANHAKISKNTDHT